MLTTRERVVIEEVHYLKQGVLKRSTWQLRMAIARWIGVSELKAALFFDEFKHVLFHRGNFFVAKREGEVVGAAYLKLVKSMICDVEAGDADWAVLYGLGANDYEVFEDMLVRTFDESTKRGIKTLYLGEKLKEHEGRLSMIENIFKNYLKRKGSNLKDFVLSMDPSPTVLSFQR